MGREELQHTLGLKEKAKTYSSACSYNLSTCSSPCTGRKSSSDTVAHLFVFSCLSSRLKPTGLLNRKGEKQIIMNDTSYCGALSNLTFVELGLKLDTVAGYHQFTHQHRRLYCVMCKLGCYSRVKVPGCIIQSWGALATLPKGNSSDCLVKGDRISQEWGWPLSPRSSRFELQCLWLIHSRNLKGYFNHIQKKMI